jgi:AcrR family transcriptional regulator
VTNAAASASEPEVDRRDEIVAAARQCFAQWGIARTRMDDIAEIVGIARPNLYRYFPNKQALVGRVITAESELISAERRQRIPIEGPVGPLIARWMLDGMRLSLEDEYVMALMAPRNITGSEAAMTDPEHDAGRLTFWGPILAHGRRRGEIRADLTDAQIVRWFGAVQMTFLEHRQLYPTLEAMAEHVTAFVVPSVLVPAAAVSL